ncbi:hypothetical protein DYBT9623_00683 [Dyadobacter sp. CECT 9623]|uniref:Uncharacterized protein n=1 Tax=Dyadobacter linearis TaxID=2823330 RepID=A0ABM8UKE6_9BACT|nr:hypothetical protein [Dyadobacter sp. CECT 9623]CAG5067955.1 hypothetical protein DYBT9623_00683 [Dyadobacter sp. CECT 9623]
MTSFEKLLFTNSIFKLYEHVYLVSSAEAETALVSDSTVVKAGTMFIVSYGSTRYYKLANNSDTFTTLPKLSEPIPQKDWVVCDAADTNSPKVVSNLNDTSTVVLMSTSSANPTGSPSGIAKLGLYLKAMIAGQGSAFGIDVDGVRAFIRGSYGSGWTEWRQLQLRNEINNGITTPKTSVEMNVAYPATATAPALSYPTGTMVVCKNAGKAYIRTSSTEWFEVSGVPV